MGTFLTSPQGDILTESRQPESLTIDVADMPGYSVQAIDDQGEVRPATGVTVTKQPDHYRIQVPALFTPAHYRIRVFKFAKARRRENDDS